MLFLFLKSDLEIRMTDYNPITANEQALNTHPFHTMFIIRSVNI